MKQHPVLIYNMGYTGTISWEVELTSSSPYLLDCYEFLDLLFNNRNKSLEGIKKKKKKDDFTKNGKFGTQMNCLFVVYVVPQMPCKVSCIMIGVLYLISVVEEGKQPEEDDDLEYYRQEVGEDPDPGTEINSQTNHAPP